MTHPTRLLIAALCATLIIVAGIYQIGRREDSTAPALRSERPVQPQAADLPVPAETTRYKALDAKAETSGPRVEESAKGSAISTFRQWAENTATTGFTQADQNKGMELAKARAAAMKTLIQQDPAAALREALPADLRALLPPQIAATIEQPVQTTGMVSIQMMCNHSPDAPHGNCEATPVLLEDVNSWNAYYGSQPWRSYVGQEVRFEGVSVGGELAVRSITPQVKKEKP